MIDNVLNDSWDRPTSQVPIYDQYCLNTSPNIRADSKLLRTYCGL